MLILPTATTAAMSLPFAAYLLTLSHRVIRARKSTNTLIGEHSSATGGTDPLYIAVRAHQNYLETVPTGLLLALLAELNGANRRVLAYALAGLWVLRVVNVEAGLRAEGTTGVGRKIGYYGTHTWIGAMAAWCVHLTRDYWGY
ncbi:membrane-associated, eicosanoid/glutathione metabolism protein [Tricharina praecox]|uniref:membrane-associated, eicosanoid/glutathione metabolism protein n=1 Tax=Tricharina praecox TaxID=43433 RepID=UPI00221EF179|nr:membrane-associated, eicosanoid/glutathione metabolism protein [Tricharina praecox]KAI5856629.1 membrane-associated, eicosanoid/glutathione metabolism protein [Tricharina praecox]